MGVEFDADLLRSEDFESLSDRIRRLRYALGQARHRQCLEVIGAEDAYLRVDGSEVVVDRHVQHHVARLGAEIVPAPHHVAQVVLHVLVGRELDDLRLQAEVLGKRTTKRDVDTLACSRVGREVCVNRHPQGAGLLQFEFGSCRGGGRDQAREGQGPRGAQKASALIAAHRPSPARHGWPTWLPATGYLRTAACIPHRCE